MPSITLSIPEDLYRRMKGHPEVKWSEVARRAIIEYLKRIEEPRMVSSEELLEELGEEFARALSEISLERAIRHYEMMRERGWERFSTIRAA
ncbi:hypothetical protein CW701_02450 [Candidatus Bathyarchaeota archaeon]|nr:MAG: hypothetical protein CW701_02450 [Candidatus Bathyarchaeota archaeon]